TQKKAVPSFPARPLACIGRLMILQSLPAVTRNGWPKRDVCATRSRPGSKSGALNVVAQKRLLDRSESNPICDPRIALAANEVLAPLIAE
ncbi:MAG: hypothetical protein ABI871_00605, partial [Chthoniobacterales bacterium]